MDFWLKLTPAVQQTALFVLGLILGGQVNRGIYALAWNPRTLGPWCPPPAEFPARRWWHRVPILGWIGLRHESSVHGRGYWIRPALLELALGFALPLLYAWETQTGLVPSGAALNDITESLLAPYLIHVALLALMTVATFIDFDEQTVPDAITIPGTLLGLVFALILPYSSLPVLQRIGTPPLDSIEHLRATSPRLWPELFDRPAGLAIGLSCLLAWCLALIPKLWTMRRGVRKAVPLLVASMRRSGWCGPMAAVFALGGAVISGTWFLGGPCWQSLLSSLIGMAVGGGIIWLVRVIAGTFLGEEAMGFGDVTLMAMIGSFVGWQASVMVFFLSPFIALTFAIGKWLTSGQREIAYGPYLCIAALGVIIRWDVFWSGYASPLLEMALGNWEFPVVLLAVFLLLGPMLWGVRALRELLG